MFGPSRPQASLFRSLSGIAYMLLVVGFALQVVLLNMFLVRFTMRQDSLCLPECQNQWALWNRLCSTPTVDSGGTGCAGPAHTRR